MGKYLVLTIKIYIFHIKTIMTLSIEVNANVTLTVWTDHIKPSSIQSFKTFIIQYLEDR